MTCEIFTEKTDLAVNKELSGADLIQFRNHLTACESCRRKLNRALLLNNHINLKRFDLAESRIKVPESDNVSSQNLFEIVKKSRVFLVAALILVASVFIYRALQQSHAQEKNLTTVLQNEDWQELKLLAENPDRLTIYGNEKVPIALLISAVKKYQLNSSVKINGFTINPRRLEISTPDFERLVNMAEDFQWQNKFISADRLHYLLMSKKGA